jgi:hypothetical protein
MKFRKLRIAWSVFWGLACVLLIALWVRSYWRADTVSAYFGDGTDLWCRSVVGELRFGRPFASDHPVRFDTAKTQDVIHGERHDPTVFGFRWAIVMRQKRWWPTIPYWFPVLLSASVATAPWIGLFKRQFSLRTLLIATTLVAVVLGLAVWISR